MDIVLKVYHRDLYMALKFILNIYKIVHMHCLALIRRM